MNSKAVPNGIWLEVSVLEQKARVWKQGCLLWEAPASTARLGCGEEVGSFKTPRGWHVIAEKIGDGVPLGAVFKSRKFTGEICDPSQSKPTDEDLILTRILWLAGQEEHNANTQERTIYFHGTNQEELLGTPASHGCIRLSNAKILELFDYAEVGTPVYISENSEASPRLANLE